MAISREQINGIGWVGKNQPLPPSHIKWNPQGLDHHVGGAVGLAGIHLRVSECGDVRWPHISQIRQGAIPQSLNEFLDDVAISNGSAFGFRCFLARNPVRQKLLGRGEFNRTHARALGDVAYNFSGLGFSEISLASLIRRSFPLQANLHGLVAVNFPGALLGARVVRACVATHPLFAARSFT